MREDPRTPRAPAREGRTLLGVASVIFAAVAAALVVAGLRDQGDADAVVVDVDGVVVPRPPAPQTSAPVAPTASTAPPPTLAPRTDPRTSSGTDARTDVDGDPQLSDLAARLGPAYSAVPEETEPRPRPVRLDIDAFDVAQFPVRPVGLELDGQFEVPDETEIGWYQYGATAGRDGATVLAAHVSWNGSVGPFGALGALGPGNRISVTLDDGSTFDYEVFERAIYGKLELPRERIWRNTGSETLVLITCGGDFNPELRRYRENIVVYAAPVD